MIESSFVMVVSRRLALFSETRAAPNFCYDFEGVRLFQRNTSIQSLSHLNSSVVFVNKFGVKFL